MAEKKTTPEVATKLAIVRHQMGNLEDKHYNWMIEAALEYFANGAQDSESQILRFERFPTLPIYTRYGKARGYGLEDEKREAEVAKLRASLDEYYAILAFLQALKDAATIMSAETFAAEMRASGFGRGSRR
jgi:hypothetical protein